MTDRQWIEPTLIGDVKAPIGARVYGLPSGSLVRFLHRLGLVVVLYEGRVHALAERGELVLTDEEELKLAAAFQADTMATGRNYLHAEDQLGS